MQIKKVLPKVKFTVNGTNFMGKSYKKNWNQMNLDRKNFEALMDKIYLNTTQKPE